jgi:type II secretory pathway pseudopilin PulG
LRQVVEFLLRWEGSQDQNKSVYISSSLTGGLSGHSDDRLRRVRAAASLVELLVVLFIMGIMMSMLLPALNGARNAAQARACENNVRQIRLALARAGDSKKRVLAPGQWTFEMLPYMEQVPLYELMKHNKDPNPKFPRPPLLRCPMQDEVASRVDGVEPSHYVIVLDRLPSGEVERGWEIQDVPLPFDDTVPDPWYTGPEIRYEVQEFYFNEKRGPHPPGLYMTQDGLQPRTP